MYLEYAELFYKKRKSERDYNNAVDDKERLLYTVTPHSVIPKEIVNHISPSSNSYDKFVNYSAMVTEIDERIKHTKDVFNNRTYLLKIKELELRESKDLLDKIYVYKWLDGQKEKHFFRLIGYSRAQTYRIVDEMRKKIKEIERKVKDETK